MEKESNLSSPQKEATIYLSDDERPKRKSTPTGDGVCPQKRPRPTSSQEWLDTPTRAQKRLMGPSDVLASPQLQQLQKLEMKTADQLDSEARQLVMTASLVLQSAQSKRHKEHLQKMNELQLFYEGKLSDKSKERDERVDRKVEKFQNDMKEKEKEREALQETLQQLQRQLTSMNAEKEKHWEETKTKWTVEKEKLNADIAKLKKARDNDRLKFEKVKQRNDFLQNTLDKREKDVMGKIKAYERLEKESKSARKQLENDSAQLRKDLEECRRKEADLKSKYDVLLTEHSSLCQEIDNLTASIGGTVTRSKQRRQTLNNCGSEPN